jgi:hypothetical protein
VFLDQEQRDFVLVQQALGRLLVAESRRRNVGRGVRLHVPPCAFSSVLVESNAV